MGMVPHERALVKRLANKPVALLGGNFDGSKENLKKCQEKNSITWRSWFDGRSGGPIAKQWNISALPTIYVLDARGIIRYKGVEGAKMDAAVDTLLKEMTGTN